MESLKTFFAPQSVVVIGASRNPQKLGYGVSRNLIGSGYRGDIFLVNPGGGELFGYPLISSVAELPEGIDLGLVVVPPEAVAETLSACSHKKINSFIILTGGFSEAGAEGEALEAEIKSLIKDLGLRVIGPNCIGILDTHLPMDTTFIQPPMPEPGGIAFITHSGALGAAMIDWSRGEGFGFSRVISLGNQIDLTESDVLLPTAAMPETSVVTMYIEGIGDGEAFLRSAAEAGKLKPLIAMKVGRSEAGKRAAASHTGALAGSDSAYEAAFRRAGVLRAETTEQMFSWARLLSAAKLPAGNRVAILTNAGGPGVAAADAAVGNSLVVAELSPETRNQLAERLPPAASVANPVDMLASASPQVYAECLRILVDAPEVDLVMVICPPPPMFDAAEVVRQMVPVIQSAGKPVAVSLMGSRLVADASKILRENLIAEFRFPEDAASALGALWRHRQLKLRDQTSAAAGITSEQISRAAELISGSKSAGGFADPEDTLAIITSYGLPVLKLYYAGDEAQAVETAAEIGYPVVMKLAVSGVSHKSDLGGVLLGLEDEHAVRSGFEEIKTRAGAVLGSGVKVGVHLQKMASDGQEVIVGAVRDPVFGPMVMFGAGGTDVEGLADVAFALAPVTRADLDDLFAQTWAGRKLGGYRQHNPADIKAVRYVILRLGQLLIDHPVISEIEINPLRVLEKGQGCEVIDARMVIKSGRH
jgi:acetate---CoA ligase (ADP-forming)